MIRGAKRNRNLFSIIALDENWGTEEDKSA
jgi:hypothetical protein